jgi:hypothetical protein
MTYTLLDSVTLTSNAASVTFSSISATGKGDLVLVIDGSGSGAYSANVRLRFNADSSTNAYSWVFMKGSGSSATSGNTTFTYLDTGISFPTTGRASLILQVIDYASSTKHKSTISRGNWPAELVVANAGRWANNAPITSIILYNDDVTFAAGSTFFLYQIASEAL